MTTKVVLAFPMTPLMALLVTAWKVDGQVDRQPLNTLCLFDTYLLNICYVLSPVWGMEEQRE